MIVLLFFLDMTATRWGSSSKFQLPPEKGSGFYIYVYTRIYFYIYVVCTALVTTRTYTVHLRVSSKRFIGFCFDVFVCVMGVPILSSRFFVHYQVYYTKYIYNRAVYACYVDDVYTCPSCVLPHVLSEVCPLYPHDISG